MWFGCFSGGIAGRYYHHGGLPREQPGAQSVRQVPRGASKMEMCFKFDRKSWISFPHREKWLSCFRLSGLSLEHIDVAPRWDEDVDQAKEILWLGDIGDRGGHSLGYASNKIKPDSRDVRLKIHNANSRILQIGIYQFSCRFLLKLMLCCALQGLDFGAVVPPFGSQNVWVVFFWQGLLLCHPSLAYMFKH